MAKPAPKQRRWFQFHLSTSAILTIVAGSILWINLDYRIADMLPGYIVEPFYYPEWIFEEEECPPELREYDHIMGQYYGWPFRGSNIRVTIVTYDTKELGYVSWRHHNLFTALNVLVALSVLVVVAMASEHVLHKKKFPNIKHGRNAS